MSNNDEDTSSDSRILVAPNMFIEEGNAIGENHSFVPNVLNESETMDLFDDASRYVSSSLIGDVDLKTYPTTQIVSSFLASDKTKILPHERSEQQLNRSVENQFGSWGCSENTDSEGRNLTPSPTSMNCTFTVNDLINEDKDPSRIPTGSSSFIQDSPYLDTGLHILNGKNIAVNGLMNDDKYWCQTATQSSLIEQDHTITNSGLELSNKANHSTLPIKNMIIAEQNVFLNSQNDSHKLLQKHGSISEGGLTNHSALRRAPVHDVPANNSICSAANIHTHYPEGKVYSQPSEIEDMSKSNDCSVQRRCEKSIYEYSTMESSQNSLLMVHPVQNHMNVSRMRMFTNFAMRVTLFHLTNGPKSYNSISKLRKEISEGWKQWEDGTLSEADFVKDVSLKVHQCHGSTATVKLHSVFISEIQVINSNFHVLNSYGRKLIQRKKISRTINSSKCQRSFCSLWTLEKKMKDIICKFSLEEDIPSNLLHLLSEAAKKRIMGVFLQLKEAADIRNEKERLSYVIQNTTRHNYRYTEHERDIEESNLSHINIMKSLPAKTAIQKELHGEKRSIKVVGELKGQTANRRNQLKKIHFEKSLLATHAQRRALHKIVSLRMKKASLDVHEGTTKDSRFTFGPCGPIVDISQPSKSTTAKEMKNISTSSQQEKEVHKLYEDEKKDSCSARTEISSTIILRDCIFVFKSDVRTRKSMLLYKWLPRVEGGK